jgi:hypothetical protein
VIVDARLSAVGFFHQHGFRLPGALWTEIAAHQSPSGCRFTTRVLLLIMKRPAGFSTAKHGARQGERAADRQRLVVLSFRVPFLDFLIGWNGPAEQLGWIGPARS